MASAAYATEPAPIPPAQAPIGKADLEQARKLLVRARTELEPRHWKLLDSRLTEAEQAWGRFGRLASESGKAAEVARGTGGVVKAVRLGEASTALSRAGPLLALLVLLWPASTAGPEHDPPAWLRAQQELEAKLRAVSDASRQVGAEIEAARRRLPPQNAPNEKPKDVPEGGQQGGRPPGKPPCIHIETRGSGAFRGPRAPPALMWCTYQCGDVRVELQVMGNSDADCESPIQYERAEGEAGRRKLKKGR